MTKDDKTRQLSVKQESAIDLLIAGKSDSEVAEDVGVTRQTVNQWKNQNPVFAAELNLRRQELWGTQVERLRGLIGNAINVLIEELHGGDPKLRHSAAVNILKSVGLYGSSLYPKGEIDPINIKRGWEKDAQVKFLSTLVLPEREID